MKLKSTLWTLAFACAAVSCSDDLQDGPNNGNNGEWTGETAQMKIFVNTDVTTKASQDAEEGDGDEAGSLEESEVKALTVFLFEDADKNKDGVQFGPDAKIVASGYSAVSNTASSTHPNLHSWEANVQLKVVAGLDDKNKEYVLAGNSFGVLSVVNAGDLSSIAATVKTVKGLGDYLQSSIYTDKQGFVMTTHMMDESDNNHYATTTPLHQSVVKFPDTNETQTVPTAEVYVERLAAKIRIYDNADKNFTFNPSEATADQVRLNDVVVINQLSSGSYLLKRVNTVKDKDLAGDLALTDADAEKDVLLGNEMYKSTSSVANFVIDPWTRAKNMATILSNGTITWPAGKVTNPTASANKVLSYNNFIYVKEGADVKNYGEWYAAITGTTAAVPYTAAGQTSKKTLYNATDNDAIKSDKPLTLAYTMENVTNAANSKNGFSTGAIFKGTYYAEKVMSIGTDNKSVALANTAWGAASGDEAKNAVDASKLSFYTYGLDANGKAMKFASLNAIFAYTLAEQVKDVTDANQTKGYYFYDSFMEDAQGKSATFDAIKVADFIASKTYTENRVADPFGYIAYLRTEVAKVNLETSKDQTMSGAKIKNFQDYIDAANDASKYAQVKPYEKGENYYLYWIQHEALASKTVTGPMEFAIVRNNVYDLTVTGITGLGLSSIDVPNPDDFDKKKDLKMNVRIKVKNWVLRKNNNIIL